MAVKAKASITLIRVNDLEGLEIGGRNLLLGSSDLDLTKWRFNTSDAESDITYQKFGNNSVKITCDNSDGSAIKYAGFDASGVQSVSVDEVKGKNLIFSMWLYIEDVGDVSNYEFRVVYNHEGVTQWNKVNRDYPYNIPLAADLEAGWNYLYGVFTISEDATMCFASFDIYAGVGESTGPCWVSSPKLEFGLTPTDWTPAPEDTDQKLDDQKVELQSSIDTAIETSEDGIIQTVTETFTTKDDFQTEVGLLQTQLTQTQEDFTFQFNSVNSSLTDLDAFKGEAGTRLDTISKYIRFLNGDILLGGSDSDVQLKIENDRIAFLDNNNEVMYISNEELYIMRAIIATQLTIGNFSWVPRSNGNVSFRYIGD